MKQSDIEQLKRIGYTEEEIRVALGEVSKIDLYPQEKEALGEKRDDRTVYVTPQNGEEQKTSSIMMGYNKQGIALENGSYVSFEEVSAALKSALSSDGSNVKYACKRTGKKVDSSRLIEEIFNEAVKQNSTIKLTEDEAMQNQHSAAVSLVEHSKGVTHNKGVMMLGNEPVKLPNGEYILAGELQRALADYVKLTPTVIEKEPEQKNKKYRVIDRIKKKLRILPVIIALTGTLLSGFKMMPTYTNQTVLDSRVAAAVEVTSREDKTDEQILEEAIEKVGTITTGSKIDMQEGIKYHESSDYKYGGANKQAEFGGKFREAGEYNVDYISILNNGHIEQVKYNEGESLGQNLKETADRLGVSISDLESYIHVGGPVSGWVSTDDLVKFQAGQIKQSENAFIENKLKGQTDNFNGNTISINDNGEEVTLQVVDENGKELKSGSLITGSNGETYRLDSLDTKEITTTKVEQVETGSHLTWSIHNINAETALLAAAASIVASKIASKKEKKMVTLTEEQIEEKVEMAKSRFTNNSEFEKAATKLVNKNIKPEKVENANLKSALINQQITVEDIENLGGPQL